jgi:hypothetical protein
VSLTAYLRWLMTPDRSRWKPMLMGLGLSAAGAGVAVLLEASAFAAAAMTVLAFAAWVAGACAMVGYVRWFFASELTQARRDGTDRGD